MSENQIDELYEWIKKVINSCEKLSHVEPCRELIGIFERKNPPEYLVTSLSALVNLYEELILDSKRETEKFDIDDRIYALFNKGHNAKVISEMTSQKYHHVLQVIDSKMKSGKRK